MTRVPDGVEVVATLADAARLERPPLLVLDRLTRFLDDAGIGTGPLEWTRIGDGHSNITYRLDRDGASVVLRRGPRPPFPRSAHDMAREARIQGLLSTEGVRVPDILALCEDPEVLGTPFYLMSYVEGSIITDRTPAVLDSPAQRRAASEALVDALIELHAVDVSRGPLAEFGRADGYLERQVRRFGELWPVYATRDLPLAERIGTWLAANLPETRRASVVHGDYRFGNVMFAADAPARVVAILDWEMATLGDPLADLGYLLACYSEAGTAPTALDLSPVTVQDGYLNRAEIIERYAARHPVDASELAWYQVLALWKAGAFLEAIYARWLRGERPDDHYGPTLETGVPQMLQTAWEMTS